MNDCGFKNALSWGLGLFFLFGLLARAEDWPQWGGRAVRNMYSTEKGLPAQLDPGKLKAGTEEVDVATAKNLKRVFKLGSQSYGNVTVAGGKIFVGTNNEFPRDPQHKGDRSILLCFDEKTGEFLWQLVVPKLAVGKANDYEALGILSSPTVEGNRVYIVTSRCEVMCLDVNGLADGNDGPFKDEAQYAVKDVKLDAGKPTERPMPPAALGPRDADIIWVYDMMDELGVYPRNAANCSVLIVDDVVYACTSNGTEMGHNNIPSPYSPSLIALDKKTGKLLAQDDAGIGQRIFQGQWSSPSLGVVNGHKLILFGAGDGWCYAFEPATPNMARSGVLKTVWKFDCNPPEYRFKDGQPMKYSSSEGPSEVNATPVCFSNRVYVAIGQDPEQGDGVGRLVCLDATKNGDVTQSGLVWDFKKLHRSLSTVAIDPDTSLLFTADFAGFVYCLDALTGKELWSHDTKGRIWGSPLAADGKVYIGNEDGDLVVFADGREKNILSKTMADGREQFGFNFGAPLYGTPLAANGVLYIQTHTHLYAFQKTSP